MRTANGLRLTGSDEIEIRQEKPHFVQRARACFAVRRKFAAQNTVQNIPGIAARAFTGADQSSNVNLTTL